MATLATLSRSSIAAQRHEGDGRPHEWPYCRCRLRKSDNGLEVRRQLAGQPDQLDITLAFTLKPSARRNAIEIAINIYLEQCRRMVAGPPFFQRLKPDQSQAYRRSRPSTNASTRTNRIVLGHVVVKHGREKCALASVNPLPQSLTSVDSRLPIKKKINSIRATFHTAWARATDDPPRRLTRFRKIA